MKKNLKRGTIINLQLSTDATLHHAKRKQIKRIVLCLSFLKHLILFEALVCKSDELHFDML